MARSKTTWLYDADFYKIQQKILPNYPKAIIYHDERNKKVAISDDAVVVYFIPEKYFLLNSELPTLRKPDLSKLLDLPKPKEIHYIKTGNIIVMPMNGVDKKVVEFGCREDKAQKMYIAESSLKAFSGKSVEFYGSKGSVFMRVEDAMNGLVGIIYSVKLKK